MPTPPEAAEAGRLGVDPVVWTRLQKYWVETNDGNKEGTLEGYEPGTLRRHDLKTLKEGGQPTGDIASEIARRIADSASHVAFLDDASSSRRWCLSKGGGLQIQEPALDAQHRERRRITAWHRTNENHRSALRPRSLVLRHCIPVGNSPTTTRTSPILA